MGKKCCAPNCQSGYKGGNMIDISTHKFHDHWKKKFPRGGEWKVKKIHLFVVNTSQMMTL